MTEVTEHDIEIAAAAYLRACERYQTKKRAGELKGLDASNLIIREMAQEIANARSEGRRPK